MYCPICVSGTGGKDMSPNDDAEDARERGKNPVPDAGEDETVVARRRVCATPNFVPRFVGALESG